MRFSTRSRYGLRFLLRLAAQPKGQLLQLGQVARDENISPGYLEQIVRALKPLGILRAVRGSGGGYALAKSPSKINMEDVFQCLEGGIAPVQCLHKGENCCRQDQCISRDFWQDFDCHIRSFLRQHTLQQIWQATKQNHSGDTHVGL